ncbi:hypothetical protein QYE76_069525 [Lolium multiflorum]|uniref:CCHC-type domain-containing protein n=1 Tax=Lolium multiflorum TaxID=4521 RepID=A0AAD8SIS6_LOLMU|nr:hypothetical protein QYE76_069525 [Lolium multiflorum]
MNKELPELFGMLKAAEIEIKKEHQVLMVNKTSFKKQGKSTGKFKKGGKKAATPPMKPKNGPKPDAECYYCKEKGHWKRNCSKYLADLKSGLVEKKKEGISDIHVIDVYLTGSRSSTWVRWHACDQRSARDQRLCGLSPRDGPAAALVIPAYRAGHHRSPWVFDANTFSHQWDNLQRLIFTTTTSLSTKRWRNALPSSSVGRNSGHVRGSHGELKKKYDEIKSALEADLIGSFHRPAPMASMEGVHTEGALDGVDLSTPSEERTRSLRREINFMVAHSLHRHSESPVNTLERAAARDPGDHEPSHSPSDQP